MMQNEALNYSSASLVQNAPKVVVCDPSPDGSFLKQNQNTKNLMDKKADENDRSLKSEKAP